MALHSFRWYSVCLYVCLSLCLSVSKLWWVERSLTHQDVCLAKRSSNFCLSVCLSVSVRRSASMSTCSVLGHCIGHWRQLIFMTGCIIFVLVCLQQLIFMTGCTSLNRSLWQQLIFMTGCKSLNRSVYCNWSSWLVAHFCSGLHPGPVIWWRWIDFPFPVPRAVLSDSHLLLRPKLIVYGKVIPHYWRFSLNWSGRN